MVTEVYIEDQLAQLTTDISALFTYAIDDVKDFTSRDTSFSKTIIFPGSNRNNAIFGHAFEFAAYNAYDPNLRNVLANYNAAKAAQCRVLIHGIQVFKGVIRLLEVRSIDGFVEYETAMFGTLGGLVTAIGNRLLTGNSDTTGQPNTADDLDFSSYDQAWTHANIIASWADRDSTGGGSGVYFPLLDYGLCTTDRINFSYQAMRPALYVHEYIVNILELAGYTWDSPFMETDFFKRLIVPHNEDQVYRQVRQLIDNRSNFVDKYLEELTPPTGGVKSRAVNFSTVVSLINFTPTYSTAPVGSTFTYTGGALNARIHATLLMTYGGGQGLVSVTATINVNASPVDSYTFILSGAAATSGYPLATHPLYISLDAPSVTLLTGDVITVSVDATYPGIAPSAWRIDLAADSKLSVVASEGTSVPAGYGDNLSINMLIPKGILQKDFLMSIVKMFNLRIYQDANIDNHVIITPYIDFYDNTDPLDWSNKLDRGKAISLKPMSEVNARYFNFSYEKDVDYDNKTYFDRFGKGYADRTYDAGFDFVSEKSDLKLIFASSVLVGVSGLDKAVTRIMKYDNGTEGRIASKIRILQTKRIAVGSWNVLQDDLTTVINNTAYYGYAGHINDPELPQGADLNFGAPAEIYWTPANPYKPLTIYSYYYSPYLAEITDKDSKLLTAYFRLSPVDILNLDFAKSIVIDGQLWRINRIVDYNAAFEDVTKAELLKVIALSY